MRAFLIAQPGGATGALTGYNGSRSFGGRWNRPGVTIVYAAESLPLAALEAFVHLTPQDRDADFVRIALDIPDEHVACIDPRELPENWDRETMTSGTQDLGSSWQKARTSVALIVPSATVPEQCCVLVNPEHPDTRDVIVHAPEPFRFDSRLWKA